MMSGIVKGLKEEGKVTLTGFCTFNAVHKDAKVGRNPRTGEAVQIPARVAAVISICCGGDVCNNRVKYSGCFFCKKIF